MEDGSLAEKVVKIGSDVKYEDLDQLLTKMTNEAKEKLEARVAEEMDALEAQVCMCLIIDGKEGRCMAS